jgi:hypothetical protein
MVQELGQLQTLTQCFKDTIAWCDISVNQRDETSGLESKHFFEFLRERDVHNMARHWRLIEQTAHTPGALLRKFVFTPPGKLLSMSDETLQAELGRIAGARSSALKSTVSQLSDIYDPRGAIIYFEPWLSIYDGAAMVGSGGFFDVENFPPADTWITYIPGQSGKNYLSGFLLSWVPEELVDVVDRGVRVDPSGSLRWAHEETNPAVQDLCRQLQLTCPVKY